MGAATLQIGSSTDIGTIIRRRHLADQQHAFVLRRLILNRKNGVFVIALSPDRLSFLWRYLSLSLVSFNSTVNTKVILVQRVYINRKWIRTIVNNKE